MTINEFALIQSYFTGIGAPNPGTRLTVGDDAAVCSIPSGQQLVTSIDTLVSGVHFLADAEPADIACKALAVNLSDLAAMAAEPAWFLLSLTMPTVNTAWIEAFSAALAESAQTYGIELIGGDTCRGELSITIQISGLVPESQYVTRAGARPGDLIVVSGSLGTAALGLAHLQGEIRLPDHNRVKCVNALLRPHPRLELVTYLRQHATAAIDISDGLQADLGHLLQASGCGAVIERSLLPVNDWIRDHGAYHLAMNAGDDYEICCCIKAEARSSIDTWNRASPQCPLTVIGEVSEAGFTLLVDGKQSDLSDQPGFQHFD